MNRDLRAWVFLLAAQIGTAASADAGGEALIANGASDQSRIEVTVTPFYGWVPGMTGTVGVFGVDAALDVTPLDIAQNIGDLLPLIDGLYLGGGEIRYGKVGFLYDVLFMDVSIDQGINGRFVRGSFGVGFRQSTTTLAASYRVLDTGNAHIDAIAGVRIWNVETDVQLETNILSANLADGDRWVDPMIGMKGSIPLSHDWALGGWALIGGFGAGSDFAWDLYGAFDYAYSANLMLSVGFRAVSADYQNGEFTWDMVQYGPMANVSLKF